MEQESIIFPNHLSFITSSSSSHNSHDNTSTPIIITGYTLYGFLLITSILAYFFSWLKARKIVAHTTITSLFNSCLILFILFRLAWFSLHCFSSSTHPLSFSLNRVAFALYFTSFLIVLFHWIHRFYQNHISAHSDSSFLSPQHPILRLSFFLILTSFWIYQTVIVLLYFVYDSKEDEGNPIYEINIATDAGACFIISILFLLYGVRLFIKSTGEVSELSTQEIRKEIWKILIVTVFFAVCFFVRVVVLSYRPIKHKRFNDVAFWLLGYFLSEVGPSLVQIYIVQTTRERQRQVDDLLDSLYEGESDGSSVYMDHMSYGSLGSEGGPGNFSNTSTPVMQGRR